MKIYKDKQYLVFDFENEQIVKYDFATKTAIGKKGKPVKNLKSQLRDLSIDTVIDSCVDKQYAKFLRYIKTRESSNYKIYNIGTILERVPLYSNYEQLFSAGFDDIIDRNLKYSINDIPKSLIKLCKDKNIKLSNNFIKYYKDNIDSYLLAYNLKYNSLTDNDIYNILSHDTRVFYEQSHKYECKSYFNILIKDYGYSAKSLLLYIDKLHTYEALTESCFVLRELYDYVKMLSSISTKYEKYPRNFLTTHKIACRNYNRLKQQYEESLFSKCVNTNMEWDYKCYKFIYPKTTQDIKDESVQQNNCVSSYIDRVIDRKCDILFMRYKDSIDKSLVTIEVVDGKIKQALQNYNLPLEKEQKEAVSAWEKWYAKQLKKNSEENENDYINKNNNESEENEVA